MNTEEFDAFLARSDVKHGVLKPDAIWVVSIVSRGGMGYKARRSQRYFKLPEDGLVYNFWQLWLDPPAFFNTPEHEAMLADSAEAQEMANKLHE